MKKFLIILVTLVLIIAIGMPYGISLLLQRGYYKIIAELKTKQPGLEVAGTFTLGWLTSSARTQLKTKPNNSLNFSLELEHTMQNGPIIVDMNQHIVKTNQLAIINTKIIGQAGLEIVTEAQYNGDLTTKIKNSPGQQKLDIGQINWGEVDATIKHNRENTYFNSTITISKLIYQELNNLFELREITLANAQQTTALGLWTGKLELKFKQGAIKTAESDVLTIDGGKGEFIVTEQGSAINYHVTLKIDHIFEAGSNNKVGPLVVGLGIDNIDNAALKQVRELGTVAANDPTIEQKMALIWRDILLKQPKIKLNNTEINLPLGKVVLAGAAKIGGAKLTAINKPELIKSIEANLTVAMAKALVYDMAAKKIEQDIILEAKDFDLSHEGQAMPKPYKLTLAGRTEEIEKRVLLELAKLVAEELLIEQEQSFNTKITMQDGVLKVNSKAIPWGF